MATKIISVCGANGSGKTTMAVNLATALTQTGSVVGLIQTELAYPSIQGFLGMRIEENKPNIKNILFDTTGKYDIEQQFQQYPKNKKLFVLSVSNYIDCLTFADKHVMDDIQSVHKFWMNLRLSNFDVPK